MKKYRFLLLRRVCQIAILFFLVMGNYSIATLKDVQNLDSVGVFAGDISRFFGDSSSVVAKEPSPTAFIAQGDLSYASWFGGLISLSDPLAVAQIFLAGGALAADVLIGLVIVLAFYGIFAGRAYCAFVCPMNLITDSAAFLRRKLGLNAQRKLLITRNARFTILGIGLILSALFGVAAFEIISPISMLHRGLVFGMGFGVFALLAVFLFDLFVLKNGFCGHICPLGATFSLIGKFALLRIKHNHTNCTKCMQCVQICPEPEVLKPIGKESGCLNDIACIRCGRCIEVCDDNALKFGILSFNKKD